MVGAGASGALTTAAMLDRFAARGLPAEIVLIDPARTTGRGIAFSTRNSRHLLNVVAGGMSAHPDDPGDFVRWLSRQRGTEASHHEYVPRSCFGDYVGEFLAETRNRCAHLVPLRRVHDTVVRVQPAGTRLAVRLASGGDLDANAVILAVGNFPPGRGWMRGCAAGVPVHDPWESLEWIPGNKDVLLVGTGLTAIDVTLSLARPGRVVHAVSRRGLLPQAHLGGASTYPAPEISGARTVHELRATVLRHIAASRRDTGDWRPGFDSLRTATQLWWQRLPGAEREKFLAEYRHLWDTHRHRMPPAVREETDSLRESGALRVYAGEIEKMTPEADGVRVVLSNGASRHVAAVINCTGPQADMRKVGDPLIRQLLGDKIARPGPCGLGLDTFSDGLLRPAGDRLPSPLWTIGAMRRGNLWESVAIPEIRQQAVEVAESVFGWVHPQPHRCPVDGTGVGTSAG